MSANESPKIVSAPIRMSPELMDKVTEAANRTGQKQAEILRLCLEIGIEDLRSCGYNLPKLVADTARALRVYAPKEVVEKTHWLDLCGGVAAGSQIATDAPNEPIQVPKAYDDDCYALRVFGQSMEPKIADGSVIVVQRMAEGTFPKKESIVVYSDAYGLALKQLGYRKAKADEDANAFGKVAILKSLNPKFPEIKTMDGGKIEAVFVETL